MKLVLVEWVDSNGGGGWTSLAAAVRDAEDNELRCESVGWLLAETDRYLLLTGSRTVGRSGSDQACDTMQIPRCAITGVRSLTPGRKQRT